MNLLIVNDEHITTKMIKEKVPWDSIGIEEVFCAYSAAEAQDILDNNAVDVLLCDIEMPGEDGIELIRRIKKDNYDCECIFLTCHADFKYAHEAIRLGVTDYLLLPTRYEEIAKAVKKAMDQRKARQNYEEVYKFGQTWLDSRSEELNRKTGHRITPEEVARNCTNYIQSHLSSMDLTVSQLASEFYLNRMYLNRIFKNVMKVSISQYIINERMKLAAQLLKKPELSMNAIAEGVGYSSYSYFVSAFKKYYDCTPSQYRKNCLGEPGE